MPEYGISLGKCFKLETIDVAGCRGLGDDFLQKITSGELAVGTEKQVPGLQHLATANMNFLTTATGSGICRLLTSAKNLTQLEVAGCELLQEYDVQQILTLGKSLEFIDINHIPIVTAAFFDSLKATAPDLKIRAYQTNLVDLKDNGLRIPLRLIGAAKKKKKAKKGKKKK